MIATDPVLIDARSHSVSLGYRKSLEKEEFFPNFTAVWRGKPYHVDMEASRYAYADGDISDWRIFARHVREGYTELARKALGDACQPLVVDWLKSDAYKASRAQAFARQIASTLREERYSTHRTRQLLDSHFSELTDEDSARLHKAADILDEFRVLVQA
jgi:hypothetical protein